ncbi:hypothetical protein RJT34_12298 [Clitoria ternatea]|uniref:Prephenate dehydratase domain-containing protein n=1 Tax=Clitoria ternatea TaxID=43366 RepID=A0AAN9JQ27_CLITE
MSSSLNSSSCPQLITISRLRSSPVKKLPEPLRRSAADCLSFSLSPSNEPSRTLKAECELKGHTGAYSEDATLKAYPNCETVPCDEFETIFKAVELRLADRVVLPIKCSIGGSIHHNFDLLLRHRLHIGKVQLKVNHCLLALSGVRKEELKGVMSHSQIVASNKKRDTTAIASSSWG